MKHDINEVREAAKRYQAANYWEPNDVTGEYWNETDHLTDASILADEYLAEHPADENEPVTEEFVVSLNPPRYWEAGCEYAWPDVGLRYAVEIGDGQPPVLAAGFYLDAASGPVYLRHIKTRGEARALLEALGGVSHG